MQDIRCKRCNSNSHVKSGHIRGNQRYKFKGKCSIIKSEKYKSPYLFFTLISILH